MIKFQRLHKKLKYGMLIGAMLLLTACNQAISNSTQQPSIVHHTTGSNILLSRQFYAVVPLRQASYSNTLLGEFSINKNLPQAFIIDTGSTITTIDPSLYQQYQLKTKSQVTDNFPQHKIYIPTLQFAQLTAKNVPAYLENIDRIKIDKQPIAGVMGLDFLRLQHALFDSANQRLYFPKTASLQRYHTPLITTLLKRAGYHPITLARTPSGHQVVLVSINHTKPVHFLLDSGVPMTMLSDNYAKKLGLKLASQPIVGKNSEGQIMHAYKTTVDLLSVGDVNWTPKEISAINIAHVSVGMPIEGVLGLDWMQAHRAILDAAHDMVWIK